MKIAKAGHPKGDSASWNMLAGCGEASLKKQASAITETFISALNRAVRIGLIPSCEGKAAEIGQVGREGGVSTDNRCNRTRAAKIAIAEIGQSGDIVSGLYGG